MEQNSYALLAKEIKDFFNNPQDLTVLEQIDEIDVPKEILSDFITIKSMVRQGILSLYLPSLKERKQRVE